MRRTWAVTELDIHKLVDFDKCLHDEDVIHFPTFTTGAWRWKRYAFSGLLIWIKKSKIIAKKNLTLFLYSPQIRLKPTSLTGRNRQSLRACIQECTEVSSPQRRAATTESAQQDDFHFWMPWLSRRSCNEKVRSCRINGKNIAEVVEMPYWCRALHFLHWGLAGSGFETWVSQEIAGPQRHRARLSYPESRYRHTIRRGGTTTKIAKYINSALTDMAYVLMSQVSDYTLKTYQDWRTCCVIYVTTATPFSSSSITEKSSPWPITS